MKPKVVKSQPLYFKNKAEPKEDPWYKNQEERLKQHILDGKPISYGGWPPPPEITDEAHEWAYIGISELLRFYKQYAWPTTSFYCKAVPNITNLSGFVEHHIAFMHLHKGRKEYLPSLKLLKDLKTELSKKKNLPKKRKL